MEIIVNILIFCIVLFLYLHIYFHLKTSDDLEVYEIDQPSKVKLEEICDLRQPVIFDFINERLLESCKRQTIVDTYGAFDVKIRNVKNNISDEEELYVPISFTSAKKAMKEDIEEKYLVENNGDFLEETGMIKSFRYNDSFLRPYMVSNCAYDYMSGSNGMCTPFRYDINYRNYFLVTEGTVKIKLAPPRSDKYLYTFKDYENFEFRSPVNAWNVQQQYRPDFDKIKCLDVVVKKGQIIFIPAFWWNTMKFEEDASVCVFKYKTYMNTVAIIPQLFMRFLQSHNVKRNIISNKVKVDNGDSATTSIDNIKDKDKDKINNAIVDIIDANSIVANIGGANIGGANIGTNNILPDSVVNAATPPVVNQDTSSIDSLPISTQ
jgi:hypothetical protein